MKTRKLIAAVLCLCMAASVTGTAVLPVIAEDTPVTIGDMGSVYENFLYKEADGGVEITAYAATAKETKIIVPSLIEGKTVVAIGDHGLYGTSAETIKLSEGITRLGSQALGGNGALTAITIPWRVLTIGDEAFLNCPKLEKVVFLEDAEYAAETGGLTSIGTRAFYNTALTEVTIPATVKTLGEQAFDACKDLADIHIENGNLTQLPVGAFYGCDAAQELVLPESITYISERALPRKLQKLTVCNPDCDFDGKTYQFLPQSCTICAPEGSLAQIFAEAYNYPFEVYVPTEEETESTETPSTELVGAVQYDVNADGSFNILDIIHLTKYLHLKADLKDASAADMDGDGCVDVFDLALMMRALVELNPEVTFTAEELSAKIQAKPVETVTISEDVALGQTTFALDLLRNTMAQGENVLVSPYSVSQALGMTANGADGKTLSEMESVLGAPMDALNPALYSLRTAPLERQRPGIEYAKLDTANSIWVQEGYPVSEAFLQTNADYYAAQAYRTPMDETTMQDVNHWVDKYTDHMIPEILAEPPYSSRMLLVNAVAFDGLWSEPFHEFAVQDETFTAADGKKQTVKMMHNAEDGGERYLHDDHAEGFLKYYEGGQYAFAALLPEEGMTPEAYIETLDAASLREMLQEQNYSTHVKLGLPEFSYDYSAMLKKPLSAMGMPTAFDVGADFSRMTDEPNELYIDSVIHKTFIEVNPTGTRAAAATAVLMNDGAIFYEDVRTVILDRPFVYMIVDTENTLPIFIGTVNSIESP